MAGVGGQETSVKERYFFSRSFRDSARLHLQHYIWKERLGYLLHPSIPRSPSDCWRVADVGTGNACWLLDAAAHEFPASWKLEGFDVSGAQFPASTALPPNVTLHVQDAFAAELPPRLIGAFDIVHIRAFAAVVKRGDPRPLLAGLVRMLRPGGYLQWDELDSATFAAHLPPPLPPSPSLPSALSASSFTAGGESVGGAAEPTVSKLKTDRIVEVYKGLATQMQLDVAWIRELPAIFNGQGLEVKAAQAWDHRSCTPLLRKMYTDNWMMALEEVCFMMIERGDVAGVSLEQFKELLSQATEETQTGVSLWIDFMVTVGQKPS